MKKIGLGIFIAVVATVLSVSVALALPNNRGVEKAPPEGVNPFPPQLSESQLTKVVFIRYAPGKESACDDDEICEPKENWKNCPNDCTKGGGDEEPPEEPTNTCYGFLSGAKPSWNWVEDYYYSDQLEAASTDAVATWESVTSGDIFRDGVSGDYPWGVYDNINSISIDDYADPNVLGVTAIWYRGKNIYEYDIMLDSNYFPGVYDLDTVVLHEFGHAAGLDDLYDPTCTPEVMYGIYDEKDLDLGEGDKTGIWTLYGN